MNNNNNNSTISNNNNNINNINNNNNNINNNNLSISNPQFIPTSPSQTSSNFPSPRHDIGNANVSSSTKIFVGGLHYDTRDGNTNDLFLLLLLLFDFT